MKLFTRLAGVAAVALSLAIVACQDPTPPVLSLTGQWQASKDPAQTIFPDADVFSFSLTQSGSTVTGTWGATGPGGVVVVKPNQLVVGEVLDGGLVVLALRYDRAEHGCTGPSSECYALNYRLIGALDAAGHIGGHVLGPPNPTVPDSELTPFAAWTLVKR